MLVHDVVNIQTLKPLLPIGAMSDTRLGELVKVCYVEHVSRTLDPFRVRPINRSTVYLLKGELALTTREGAALVIVGGTDEARHPIGRKAPFESARAITDLELIRFDDELVDIMMTWDQLDEAGKSGGEPGRGDAVDDISEWRLMTGVFSLKNLQAGGLSQLPREHVGALLKRFARVNVRRGEQVVREGSEADFYYVIEDGRAQVSRRVGGVEMQIAQLKGGDTFGEESLLGDGRRNATVVMLSDGSLLRLTKADFHKYLMQPLLVRVDASSAMERVANGGQWIDVRYPSEYQYDRLPGALNIPLGEVRHALKVLDPKREYVVYCQTGRRSSAAAFLLAQRGIKAAVLEGGLSALVAERT